MNDNAPTLRPRRPAVPLAPVGLLLALFLLGCAAPSQSSFDHGHAVLDSLLTAHVRDGLVDYAALAADGEPLQRYLRRLGELAPETFEGFTRAQKLALLINAYNAFTLALIVDHYPVDSIRDISGNWTDRDWLLLGKRYSLNQIENDLIRPGFQEPRIHCALVCAALSCPPLASEAYVADRLEEQLTAVATGFVRNRSFNRLDTGSAKLYASKIFKWYRDDFVPAWGETELPPRSKRSAGHRALIGFFREHLRAEEAQYLATHAVSISFQDYDWNLNVQRDD